MKVHFLFCFFFFFYISCRISTRKFIGERKGLVVRSMIESCETDIELPMYLHTRVVPFLATNVIGLRGYGTKLTPDIE